MRSTKPNAASVGSDTVGYVRPVPSPSSLRLSHLPPSTGDAALSLIVSLYSQALTALNRYDLKACLSKLDSLGARQGGGVVSSRIRGLAHFSSGDYPAAKLHLEHARSLRPSSVKCLDVLSTAYWHLKQDVELSFLARTATALSPYSPEPWVCAGNCFSLQKEHDLSLKFFHRATSLDPSFTYAHTLAGHEYVSNEDFASAIRCFRMAVGMDGRHYNAWYGLGAIYFRQEKVRERRGRRAGE